MIAQYKPNPKDKLIIDELVAHLTRSISNWYGEGARLDTHQPEIRSYRNCFILRFPITRAAGEKKTVLVKIRRNPKMDSLWQTVDAQIHANIPTEYSSLEFVFGYLSDVQDFGVIRPLEYIEKYHAIVMEEYPSHTLRKILVDHRSSKNGNGNGELVDAATKTGKWLHYFHHHIHTPAATPYSASDILDLVREYAERLESSSRGRVNAQAILDSFADKLKNIQIDSMVFSQSHADMTCDNVLYSDDGKVCVIDIKTRPAPIYSDLGLILTHPETFKSQIFSGGTYFPEPLLKEYRDAIIAGYFEDEPVNDFMVKLFSAIKVLDKWTMYEELMNKYKGFKHLLAVPVGPFVTSYFQSVLRRHLDSISTADIQQPADIVKPVNPTM